MQRHRPKFLLLLPLFAAGCCAAQEFELSFSGGYANLGGGSPIGHLGYGSGNSPGNPVRLGNGTSLCARASLNAGRFGHEAGISYTRNTATATYQMIGLDYDVDFQAPRATWQSFYNLLFYFAPEESRVRPFLAVGPHVTRFTTTGSVTFPILGVQAFTKFGVNGGGGVKCRLTKLWSIRLDARDYITAKPFNLLFKSGLLHHREFSAGVGLAF